VNRNVTAILFSCLVGFIAVTACGRHEPPSAIVQAAEQSGSGDLTAASAPSIQGWLGKHPQVADRIEVMCRPARQNAAADWGDTTEGRLCGAAHEIAFFRSAPARGDGKTFRPGLN
jgi:hypothetical protein